MTSATLRWTALLLLAVAAPAAVAQSLGDEFIFFVDGTNVMVPTSEASVVNDPADPASGNKVARFNAGAYTHRGFAWERSTGVDASGLVGETYGESDTLYLRLWSSPENALQGMVQLWFTDKTDGSNASREDIEAGTATADHEMRLQWAIPPELHDGMWHDLAIPLPPATYAALEEARANGDLDDAAANWQYTGAWTAGGYGIGLVGGTDPGTDDPLFREFEWDALYKFGPVWDNPVGGGPIYLDDVYIGGPDTDLGAASAAPAAMSGVTFTADGPVNVVDWEDTGAFGGYNVYASQSPITDVSADGVVRLKSVGFGEETELRHRYEVPHPSLGNAPLYYAVTSLSAFGVENPDVTSSTSEIANPNLAQKAYIRQLTADQADGLFDDVSNGVASSANFPADQPVFVLDSSHRSAGDGTSTADLPSDDDLSGRFMIGYSDLNEMYIYGEITDDQVTFGGENVTGGTSYLYDSAEIVFGHYDVRETDGGGILVGSPHQDMERGEEPDYGMRMTAFTDAAGDIARTSTWVGWSLDTDLANSTAVEVTDTGWKFLTLLPLDAIQNTTEGDVFMPVPARDEIQMIPFIISLNDADGGQREDQIVWSIKPTVTDQWWNTPAMWETVAMAGLDVMGTAAENGTPRDGFALAQTAPNPVAGSARIAFDLGTAGSARIDVFNALGQRVTTVADGTYGAGSHSVTVDTRGLASGVYVYRLTAGDYVATRRMTVVR